MKPTERFSGLASIYAASRPSYPDDAIDFIMSHCNISDSTLMLDIGCGTGISTRLFAERGVKVIGVEPNDDMRKSAEAESAATAAAGYVRPEYKSGTAEDTGLPDDYANVILCAQAFHWFDAPKAFKEFHRVLMENGYVVLMWNERDESFPFAKGYGDLFRKLPETAKVEMQRGVAGLPLLSCDLFVDALKRTFTHQQEMDLEGLLGRAFSASYAPREGAAADALREGLTNLFNEHQKNGLVSLPYETAVYVGRKES